MRQSIGFFGFALVTLLASTGCSGPRPPSGGLFPFEVEGVSYQILSIVDLEGVGANYLVCRRDGRTVLRAIDGDQDGVLESVLTGTMSLGEANHVYAFGIAAALSGGKVDRREAARLFTLEDRGQSWSVRSVIDGPGAPYNTFSVVDSDGTQRAVATDDGADGTIDRLVEGNLPLATVQSFYRSTLDRGLLIGRIVREGGHLVVQPMANR